MLVRWPMFWQGEKTQAVRFVVIRGDRLGHVGIGGGFFAIQRVVGVSGGDVPRVFLRQDVAIRV